MSESVPPYQYQYQYHCNRYHAQAACEHCKGVIRHERWCITYNSLVYYAYEIVTDPAKLTLGDLLILHSLGVTWGPKSCGGSCGPKAVKQSLVSA
jgi:hypothetical protein